MARRMNWWWKWIIGTGLIVAGGIAADFARAAPQVCWQNPTENTDGTPIDDLALVRLYYDLAPFTDTSSISFSEHATTVPGDNVCVVLSLVDGDWYFRATALDADGNESALSNEVVKTVEVPPAQAVIALEPACAECSKVTAMLIVTETGDVVTLRWEPVTAESIEVEVLEYPPSPGAVPLARAQLNGTTETYDWTPSRSGLYYSRMRSCSGGECSDWSNSYEQGYVYYAELAPASGGGVD